MANHHQTAATTPMEMKKSANGVRKRSVLSASRFIDDHAVCAICPKFVACRSDQHQGGPGTAGFARAACLPRPQRVMRCHSKGFPVANSLGSRVGPPSEYRRLLPAPVGPIRSKKMHL